MSYSLSLLDKSPIPRGSTAAEALQHTIALAKRADELGYERFWLAEHHGGSFLAGSAPEIIAGFILAGTSRIRVGAGGVMLQHYSPYKVAETFGTLSALAPGRVDLGVGKAAGGFPFSTRALQIRHGEDPQPDFAGLLADLDAFLDGALPEGHALAGLVAGPVPPEPPQRILLGASVESAGLAARLGWRFAYAGHFNGDAESLARTLETYRRLSGRPAILALHAFAAETREKAEQSVSPVRLYRLHLPDGRKLNVPTIEAVTEYARQAGLNLSDIRTEELRPLVLAGTPDHVRSELDALAKTHGVNEIMLDSPVTDFAGRLASIELLAGAPVSLAA
jgi:luciferase family oxidoreductase group 1